MNISIVRAATCDGPTSAPRPTAAASASPLPCRIVRRCTDNTVEMIEASVIVIDSSGNKPRRGIARGDIVGVAATTGLGAVTGRCVSRGSTNRKIGSATPVCTPP